MKKNTIIFDLDGTLLDTLADLKNSLNFALSARGYPERTLDETRRFVGNGIARLIEQALPGGGDNPDLPEILRLFHDHYNVHCNDNTKPYDGVMELLTHLQAKGIRMAIVSNKPDFAVKELNGIYFKGKIPVAIGEKESEGIRRKPAPDTVFTALSALGSTREEAVYVGDSEVDFATAENSGMDCILCTWGFRDEKFLKTLGAKHFAASPSEILTIVSP